MKMGKKGLRVVYLTAFCSSIGHAHDMEFSCKRHTEQLSDQGFAENNKKATLKKYAKRGVYLFGAVMGAYGVYLACKSGWIPFFGSGESLFKKRAEGDEQSVEATTKLFAFLKNEERITPTEFASLVSHADLNLQDQNGYTLLHYAVKRNDIELVKVFIQRGAATDGCVNSGSTKVVRTPLCYAKTDEMRRLLLSAGANPNQALPVVVANDFFWSTWDLLSAGADPSSVKSHGYKSRILLDSYRFKRYVGSWFSTKS